MFSFTSCIHPSVEEFIAHPENHHLINKGGVIQALSGRSDADETVHQTALDALNALSKKQGTSPSGIASFLSSVIPLSISSDPSLINRCQQAEFTYKINNWAEEPGQGPEENRAEAAIRIKKAYTNKHKALYIDNFRLTSLPRQIGQIAQLQQLNLGGNRLNTLPPEIGQLKKLEQLYLSHNQFAQLPAEITQLIQLKKLYLSHNQFAQLPAEITQLIQLKELYFNNNLFSSLPPEIGQLAQLKHLWFYKNPFAKNKSVIQIIASYPFLLKLDTLIRIFDQYTTHNPQAILNNLQTPQQLCQLNGLALEFIPHHKQTEDLVLTAITQNPASIAFARADFITYDLAKRALAIDPTVAKFIPNHLIDIATVLEDITTEPYLLSLLTKVRAFDQITPDMYKQAMAYDGRLISCLPAELQNSDFGHDLISLALKQTPLAYYGIEPMFFDATMLRVLIEAHKDKKHNADLYSILQKILVKIDVNDPLARDHYFPIADELTFSYKDDPIIMAFLIAQYGKTLVDASDNLRRDYDFVFAAIHSHPDNIRESLVIDLGQQRLLEEYARERRRQL